ncbi:Protein CBG26621 [Caenorhabditis briggsae]|uniref:Uncharacterized protein n=2 Tax=Caenorhabditis briggsae TaxID=6238 RepID=A0AAE9DWN8_CAEBR|nr:Protein CBG26621 [Caenorhabditis briggsae]ULU13600.1 hypothetical protein L3Y34_016237 [Caenorhabditis briggsae]CAS00771.1 Protein CBG26621 [Caenorhabditis briggsae]
MSGFFNFVGFGAAQESNEIAPKMDEEAFESGDSSFEMLDSGDEAYETPEGSIASSSSFEKLSEDSGEEEEEEDVTNFEVIAADSADLLTQLNDWFRQDIVALI